MCILSCFDNLQETGVTKGSERRLIIKKESGLIN